MRQRQHLATQPKRVFVFCSTSLRTMRLISRTMNRLEKLGGTQAEQNRLVGGAVDYSKNPKRDNLFIVRFPNLDPASAIPKERSFSEKRSKTRSGSRKDGATARQRGSRYDLLCIRRVRLLDCQIFGPCRFKCCILKHLRTDEPSGHRKSAQNNPRPTCETCFRKSRNRTVPVLIRAFTLYCLLSRGKRRMAKPVRVQGLVRKRPTICKVVLVLTMIENPRNIYI